jgi:hypothetical protein
MSDRLRQVCAREFSIYAQRLADALFDAASKLPGADDFLTTQLLQDPITGQSFFAGFDSPEMRQEVCAAIVARENFRLIAPTWAPVLPLTHEGCEDLESDDCPRLAAVGLYGSSLRHSEWAPAHPCFPRYVSGLLAHARVPDAIRNDPDLQHEFPAYPLEGLGDDLAWRSPKMLADYRRMQAMAADYDRRMGRSPAPVT